MKKNLEILEVEPKLKKDESKYWRFCTNDGWMNVFDSVVADCLKEVIGNVACVEVDEKAGTNFRGDPIVFKNIVKFDGATFGKVDEKPEVVKVGNSEKTIVNGKPTTTMYTSYAKDIFCAIRVEDTQIPTKDVMDIAIKLVKQAREAFE